MQMEAFTIWLCRQMDPWSKKGTPRSSLIEKNMTIGAAIRFTLMVCARRRGLSSTHVLQEKKIRGSAELRDGILGSKTVPIKRKAHTGESKSEVFWNRGHEEGTRVQVEPVKSQGRVDVLRELLCIVFPPSASAVSRVFVSSSSHKRDESYYGT